MSTGSGRTMRQLPLPLATRDEPRFDNFLPGANAVALAHLQQLRMPAAPVYLHGPAGSGKTHLLRALQHAARERGHAVLWFEAGTMLPAGEEPLPSLVVFDDVHRFDDDAQAAAFRTFVEASTHGIQVAAAAPMPPVDLPLREDLRTRLGWGPVFALRPLAEAQVRAALRREADRRGLLIGDEVMAYLMTRFARDLKSLMALLARLDDYALAHARPLTVPLVRRMVDEEGA